MAGQDLTTFEKLSNLVSCQDNIVGYSLFNLTLALSLVNCQLIVASLLLRLCCHASTSSFIVSILSILRFKHCPINTFNSISAMFNQLPCIGVYINSYLSHILFASSSA